MYGKRCVQCIIIEKNKKHIELPVAKCTDKNTFYMKRKVFFEVEDIME